MKHIFKQSEGSVTPSKISEFNKAVFRLTTYYSIGVCFILLIFSFVVYALFSKGLEVEFHEDEGTSEYLENDENNENEFLEEIKENLFNIIFFSDIFLLFVTIFVSYLLSKKTLAPLEESYQKQKRFVADAAHELRTPLAVIKAGSEVVLQQHRTIEEYQKFTKESLEEVDSLITLSNNLLFLAQSKSVQKNSLTKVSLSNICQKKFEQMLPYARTKNISMFSKIESNIFVVGREEDLSRLVTNLLKNAVDYTLPNGKVDMSIQKNNKEVTLAIQDTGVGIDSKDIPHIFERFYKADTSRTQSQGTGTGLGLAIVKEIVDEHNGSISVRSELGKGTLLKVILPCV